MIRIGMLSYWHVHAEDYTKQVLSHPNTEIAAIWDELPDRGAEKAAKYGVPFIANLDELLARDDIDAVVVDAPTNMHRDVMVKAALAGKHIFTEKVVAPTVSEASEIAAAVRDAGVKLAVSLPRLYEDYTQSILEVIASGKLGQLTLARVRLSHNGSTANWLPAHFYSKEQCGGGALIDLGCHPVYLVRKFLGLPESVSATFGFVSGREVEDNAVAVFSYPNGAVGIAEAGFVNSHSPFSIELHGTDGTLLYGFPEEKILVRSNQDTEKAWTEVPVGDRLPFAFEQWVGHIESGTEATENIAFALDLTRLMEAANRSAAEGKSVRLSDLQG
ncbi:Gfo/Idh/MocA family oxidoreductase [Cohnella ginsengisoli]|uniref:Gfo/Idh/MocA family oxidoreductase n=1 Tax=Cohnella ginsengisoli TaxID=425004 RepID=A0A9X4QMJ8_9BACL|nr:Gfo/Idh/MocA family oxidoreductase [Cohnella ginsengisoli]MDG0791763.1 Gfo/Idh/MocA family oxidoreductase [Cohnella ginsengisoli]